MRRIRNGISAKEMAQYLGVSYSWLQQLEKYYRGPSVKDWQLRYEEALNDLILSKKEK